MSYLHHNPFTQKIEEIQKQWIEVRTNNPDTKLFCYQCFDQDFKYLLKTIQIETTEHMVYPEFMFEFEEDFTNEKEFYFKIIFQIMLLFDYSIYEKKIIWDDFNQLKAKFKNLDKENIDLIKEYFAELLQAIHNHETFKDHKVIFFLNFTIIEDIQELTSILETIVDLLPKDFSILVLDTYEKKFFEDLLKKLKDKAYKISLPDLNIYNIIKQLATAGDPNNPEIKGRQLIFNMSEAMAKKNVDIIKQNGEKLINLYRPISDDFFAYAFLIYGAFLLYFPKEQEYTLSLFDKGIKNLTPKYKDSTQSSSALIQLYNLKATAYGLSRDGENAYKCFDFGLQVAKEVGAFNSIIVQYIDMIFMAKFYSLSCFQDILKEAFVFSYQLPDEVLKTTNITMIVVTYLKYIYPQPPLDFKDEVRDRMSLVYGENWEDQLEQFEKIL